MDGAPLPDLDLTVAKRVCIFFKYETLLQSDTSHAAHFCQLCSSQTAIRVSETQNEVTRLGASTCRAKPIGCCIAYLCILSKTLSLGGGTTRVLPVERFSRGRTSKDRRLASLGLHVVGSAYKRDGHVFGEILGLMG